MKKYTLSESKLREIIRESVKNALEEGQGWNLLKNGAKDVWKGNRVDPEKGEYKNYIKSGNAYGFDDDYYDEEGQSTNNPTNGQGKRNKEINKGLTGKAGRAAAGAALMGVNKLGKAWRNWGKNVEDADSKPNPMYSESQMKKNEDVIKLTESNLREMISEELKNILKK